MYDAPRVNVVQRAKHAPEVLFHRRQRKCTKVVLLAGVAINEFHHEHTPRDNVIAYAHESRRFDSKALPRLLGRDA